MVDYDLIRMPGETKAKVYEATDEELEAPVPFDPRELQNWIDLFG